MQMASGNVFCTRGTYTPDSDIGVINAWIQHGLGVLPDFIVAYAEDVSVSAADNVVYVFEGIATIIDCQSPQITKPVMYHGIRTRPGSEQVTINYENQTIERFMTSEAFRIPFYSTGDLLKGGVTYHWVVGKYT